MVGDLADLKALWLQATEKTGWFEKENMMLYLVWLCVLVTKKPAHCGLLSGWCLGASGCCSLPSAVCSFRPCAWGSVVTVAAHSRCSFLRGCPGRDSALISCLAWLSSHLGSQEGVQAACLLGLVTVHCPFPWAEDQEWVGMNENTLCHTTLKTLFRSEGFMWTASFIFGSMHLGERKEKNGSWHLVVSAL